MMSRTIKCWMGVLVVLLAGASAQAELKLVVNFEGMTGNPDGQACNGVLGGTLDTESDGTGDSALGAIGGTVRTHVGLIADATTNPITGTNTGDPKTVPAGFRLVDNGNGFDLLTTDGATVLKTGLARSQWYNVWIVADHAAETFDLYVSNATGPAGPATLPTPADLVKSLIPVGAAGAGSLNGMIFANPISPTGSGQATRIYIDEIWWDGDQGLAKPVNAASPSPADKEQDVSRDVVLGWKPGPSASAHDVYFGASLDDVSNADRTKPLGVLASQGQEATTFDPTGPLELGRTYYWRVDEVNAAPSLTVFKGVVWSFTVEPVSYPIAKVTATASSSNEGMGPEKTVGGVGLNASDQHATEPTQMWLSANGAVATTTVGMTGPVYVGLCVTSHNAAATTVAVMSGAAATGNVTGQWQVAAIGNDPETANSPADLYVTVQDSAGRIYIDDIGFGRPVSQ